MAMAAVAMAVAAATAAHVERLLRYMMEGVLKDVKLCKRGSEKNKALQSRAVVKTIRPKD